jgi:hypothetical protein
VRETSQSRLHIVGPHRFVDEQEIAIVREVGELEIVARLVPQVVGLQEQTAAAR